MSWDRNGRALLLGLFLSFVAVGACNAVLGIEPPGPPPDPDGGAGGEGEGGQACVSGTYACDGLSLQICNDVTGQYEQVEVCTAEAGTCLLPICNAQAHTCGTKAAPEGDACTGGHCDASGQCVSDACVLGDEDCLGDVPRVCQANGQWQSGAACAAPTPACVLGECKECAPGQADCVGEAARTCASGQWMVTPCGGIEPFCVAGACEPTKAASCELLDECLPGSSCCATSLVSAGQYSMGRGEAGASDEYAFGQSSELPEHLVNVSAYWLDDFDVTVGRFRWFVDHYESFPPLVGGEGANPKVLGSGWNPAWNVNLPPIAADLRAALLGGGDTRATWSDAAGTPTDERRPINFVSYYVAFAFCIRDGGRLPSEVEWERAATGMDNRRYPWGPDGPETGAYAVYDCLYDGSIGCAMGGGVTEIAPVGQRPMGKGFFGQYDLAGDMHQWTRDGFSATAYSSFPHFPSNSCSDCINLDDAAPTRAIRGGSWRSKPAFLRSAARQGLAPAVGYSGYADASFRCARP